MADNEATNKDKDGKPPDGAATNDAESLPPVESMDKDSDYAPFLAEGVPEELARAALRKLWRSDPALANLDGLNDYDEDFSVFQTLASAVNAHLGAGENPPAPSVPASQGSGEETVEDEPRADSVPAEEDGPEKSGETAADDGDKEPEEPEPLKPPENP